MKHRLYPTAVIIAVIIAAIFYTAHWLVVKPVSEQVAKATVVKVKVAQATTTTVEPITDWLDLSILNEQIIIYRDAHAEIESLTKDLAPILDKKREDLGDKEAVRRSILSTMRQAERKDLNTAADLYNPVARKYSKAQLEAHEFSVELRKVR